MHEEERDCREQGSCCLASGEFLNSFLSDVDEMVSRGGFLLCGQLCSS